MSLNKIIRAPIKLFKKEVITFLVIRRHDLGDVEDKLRYVAVKPNASIAALRQKLWHLLELPDYCEEIIVLKSGDRELPLTELRVGNDPQHPFFLEVWPPEVNSTTMSFPKNMLTMGESDDGKVITTTQENNERSSCLIDSNISHSRRSTERVTLRHFSENTSTNFQYSDFKKPDLGSKISTTSIFKMYRKEKGRDSFTNILLKIQSDLTTLSTKLSNLENKLPP